MVVSSDTVAGDAICQAQSNEASERNPGWNQRGDQH
ncbi:hypothetical protein CBM2586_A50109 [Cupriavidus phytorum]|uniref:Uncharacterized protein n=1 Tax=Cupriavidus taiwanensis TaxID=164546 RepID=A0A375C2M4_9BURK|nr:hypothetical protein CBM2587_A160054 [Cupriavidus taiwanensis]SOY61812.1 hypothetical protein CBM2586_A50109 [Cupriavidus taiwanensis]SPR96720.1 hypothetical protein CBM2634_A160076 [Cupriavidus taiwanensis]